MFSIYVTGTDTGIGKTLSSASLLHALRARGLRAAGMKPVASGCERIDGAWRNVDALALQRAGEPGIDYADINPFALEHPLAGPRTMVAALREEFGVGYSAIYNMLQCRGL
ncbi:MAG: ATP-dependent dethiobiotin synthetase BioD, partial [Thermomonas sp.]